MPKLNRLEVGQKIEAGEQQGGVDDGRADDTKPLRQWLIDRMRRRDAVVGDEFGRAKLTLDGAWPMLRVGDLVIDAGGKGLDAADRSEAIAAAGVRVRRVRCRWRADRGVVTEIDVTF